MRASGRIDRSAERGLHVIVPQAKILLRGRNPRVVDDDPLPASPGNNETRRSEFFEMKSLCNRRCKENPGLSNSLHARVPLLAPEVDRWRQTTFRHHTGRLAARRVCRANVASLRKLSLHKLLQNKRLRQIEAN